MVGEGSERPSNIDLQILQYGGVSFPPESTVNVEYVDGKKEGDAIVYSSQMTKLAKLHFHQDKLEGLCSFFDSEGMRVKQAFYVNDKHNGWGCEYSKGKPIFEGFYQNGKRFSELKPYSKDDRFLEEVKDGKTLSVCIYNENHKKDGLCYLYEYGVLKRVVRFEDGVKKDRIKEFKGSLMFEYDSNQEIIYQGNYRGNIAEGFERYGKGLTFVYEEDKKVKEYEDGKLVYEGQYSWSSGSYQRDGKGVVYSSQSEYHTAIFENGVEKRCCQVMHGKEMIEYDPSGKVVYKGEFAKDGKEYVKNGRGLLFEYGLQSSTKGFNSYLKEVFECMNGEKKRKRMEFYDTEMTEYNDNGSVIYKGGFSGDPKNGLLRSGKGNEFGENKMLVYSGGWKNGEREGSGRYYQNGDLLYNGEWIRNEPNGKGSLFSSDGELLMEGFWRNEDGDLENGVFHIHHGCYIELENDVVYVNEIRSGLFGCGHRWLRYPLTEIIKYSRKEMIHAKEDWNCMPLAVTSICVAETSCKGEWERDLIICGYSLLEEVIVRKNSLKCLNSLRVSDNPMLKTLSIENGGFECVRTVVLESGVINGY